MVKRTTRRKATTKSAASSKPAVFPLPKLASGERYAGVVLKDGKPSHHLILIPGALKSGTHDEAKAWAKKQGGELPTRQEQSILFGNAKEHIEGGWYWSREQHADDSAYAWGQSFNYGLQLTWRTSYLTRARAVRRAPI